MPASGTTRFTPLAPAVFVTGKGGVGKTTVAAGLAAAAARKDGSAVYVEFGDGISGRRVLGDAAGVEHVVIDPQKSVMKAAAPVFGSGMLTKLALGNFAMKPVIAAAPAVRELAVLELCRLTVAEHPGQRVVIDMPATGHSVAWLRVAQQGRDLTKRGPVHDLCARLVDELVSPGRASVAVVTLPERLVLAETLTLCQTLKSDVGLDVDRLVVNRVPPPAPPGALRDARAVAARGRTLGEAAGYLVARLEARAQVRAEVLDALSTVQGEAALTQLPLAAAEPSAAEVATWLANAGAA